MCGIAGLMLRTGASDETLAARVGPMNAALAHRGPDGEGIWTEAAAGVALAQRRLAIVDLTPTGAQPMLSGSGRYAMTYNGEIYNYREIRRELEDAGTRFRGTSDSEVLIEAWDRWGAERTLEKLNGMFAIAIFDRRERSLALVRDRMGIKPLLWFRSAAGLFFASELKGLLREASCPRTVDPASVTAYLRHGNVPAPWTIMKGVHKLEPGMMLVFPADGGEPAASRFWSPRDAVIAGEAKPSGASLETLLDEGEALIGDAVQRQMVADVPLGAFLSGGIDSSLVAAMMQRTGGRRIDTFTIGFAEKAWDESPQAEAVAAHIGTRQHTLMTSGKDAIDIVGGMATVYDEPFADSSQIPTTLLCRLVRKHVTVALSGDGGDETFAGYARYDWGLKMQAFHRRLPSGLRRLAGDAIEHLPAPLLDAVAAVARPGLAHAGHKLRRAARAGAAQTSLDGYRQLLSLTTHPQDIAIDAGEHHPFAYSPEGSEITPNFLSVMQFTDAISYLPDDILVKTDRASMSTGLEVRVPLLDHRIWNWALHTPVEKRRNRGVGKVILRGILARHVPPALTERPKAGFAVPLADWLRGELRAFAEPLLGRQALMDSGAFNIPAVENLWREHLAGRHDHGPVLWAIIMFQAWHDRLAHV